MTGALMPLVVTPGLTVIETKRMLLAAFGTKSIPGLGISVALCRRHTHSISCFAIATMTDVCPVHRQQLVNMDHSLEPMDNERPLSAFDVKESTVLSLVMLEDRTL